MRGTHTPYGPMPLPTLIDLLRKSADHLVAKGIANGRREAEWLFSDSLGLSRLELYLRFDMPVEEDVVGRLRERIMRRARREPLAYILGTQPFAGLDLAVGPGVLVPRPETEELIERICADLPQGGRLIDVGTGSGAIALACARTRPDAVVEAVDVSPEALAIACANGERCGLNVAWHQGDLLTGRSGPFDAIVANLPYIGEDERSLCDPELAFEPAVALFAGRDGLDQIRRLIPQAAECLAPSGVVWLEHGFRQAAAIADLGRSSGFNATTITDAAGHERFTRLAH